MLHHWKFHVFHPTFVFSLKSCVSHICVHWQLTHTLWHHKIANCTHAHIISLVCFAIPTLCYIPYVLGDQLTLYTHDESTRAAHMCVSLNFPFACFSCNTIIMFCNVSKLYNSNFYVQATHSTSWTIRNSIETIREKITCDDLFVSHGFPTALTNFLYFFTFSV